MPAPLSKETVRRALDLVDRGWTLERAAAEVGISAQSIASYRKRYGLPDLKARRIRRGSKPEIVYAVALVRAGSSYSEAAEAVGLTREAVAGAAWRAGVKADPKNARRNFVRACEKAAATKAKKKQGAQP